MYRIQNPINLTLIKALELRISAQKRRTRDQSNRRGGNQILNVSHNHDRIIYYEYHSAERIIEAKKSNNP